MKKYIIYIISFVVVALLQISCYDDKGDYDYHEVNSYLKQSYVCRKTKRWKYLLYRRFLKR